MKKKKNPIKTRLSPFGVSTRISGDNAMKLPSAQEEWENVYFTHPLFLKIDFEVTVCLLSQSSSTGTQHIRRHIPRAERRICGLVELAPHPKNNIYQTILFKLLKLLIIMEGFMIFRSLLEISPNTEKFESCFLSIDYLHILIKHEMCSFSAQKFIKKKKERLMGGEKTLFIWPDYPIFFPSLSFSLFLNSLI